MRPTLLLVSLVALSAQEAPRIEQCSQQSRLVFCGIANSLFVARGHEIDRVDSQSGRTVWTHADSSDVSAGPVLANGTVAYVARGGTELSGLDADTGTVLWARTVAKSLSVIAASGAIVLQSLDREGAIAVDPNDGRLLWQRSSPGRGPSYVKMLSADSETVLTNLFALRISDGEITERWPVEATGLVRQRGVTFLATQDGSVTATSRGRTLWTSTLPEKRGDGSNELTGIVAFGAGVAVLIGVPQGHALQVVEIDSSGAILWRHSLATDTSLSGPFGATGRELVVQVRPSTGNWSLVALDDSGRELWNTSAPWRLLPTGQLPCVSGACIGLATSQDSDEHLVRIDSVSGHVVQVGQRGEQVSMTTPGERTDLDAAACWRSKIRR